jgi:hypothetical protein
MVIVSVALLSFGFRPGGDHFEIYLNKKLVLQQMVSNSSNIKNLVLDQRNANDQVDVFYSHCGKVGTKRAIIIKDGKTVLKEWRFSDIGSKKFMSVGAKDLLVFKDKNDDRKLNLVYSSEEIPEGRLLASIVLDNDGRSQAGR